MGSNSFFPGANNCFQVFRRRGARTATAVWPMLLLAVIPLAGCKAKPTTKTPSGAFRLMLDAAVARDVAKMQTYCTGMAVNQCDQLFAAIKQMESSGKASKFKSHVASTGPMPTGNRANEFADLFGENRDLFMRVSVTLQKNDKGRWQVDQITWESKRE